MNYCCCLQHCGRECKSVSGMKYHYTRCGNITCSLCDMTFTMMAKFHAHHVMCHSNSSSKVLGDSPHYVMFMPSFRIERIQRILGMEQGRHHIGSYRGLLHYCIFC